MSKHRIKPIDLDMESAWDGVVKFDKDTGEFIRYVDREGTVKEMVSQ